MKTIRSLLLLLAMSVSVSAFAQYIEGTTPLLAPVAPASALDTYASHTEEYGQGGFRSVADATARDAIPADRMKVGMLVHCLDTGTIFRLSASSNWVDSGIKAAGDWVATNLLAVASAEAGRTALALGTQDSVSLGAVVIGTTNVVAAISGKQDTNVVSDLTALAAYSGADDIVLVSDANTGGTFARTTGLAADGVIVVTNTAAGSVFKRQYTGAIDPRWFGAVADDSTDDTTALQAAVDAAGSTPVELPPGEFNISSTGLYLRDNSTLIGVGTLKSADSLTNEQYMLRGTAISNVTVRGITLVGNSDVQTFDRANQQIHLCVLRGVTNCLFDGVTFLRPNGDALAFAGPSGGVVYGNMEVTVRNCTFDSEGYAHRNMISLITGTNVSVVNNTFLRASPQDGTLGDVPTATGPFAMPGAIDAEPSTSEGGVYNLLISGNTFSGASRGMNGLISLANGDGAMMKNIVVSDNIATEAYGGGFLMVVGCEDVLVTGNTVTSATNQPTIICPTPGSPSTRYSRPFWITTSTNVVVRDNSFVDFAAAAYLGLPNTAEPVATSGIRVLNNTFRNCGEYDITTRGVIRMRRAHNTTISDNTFESVNGGLPVVYMYAESNPSIAAGFLMENNVLLGGYNALTYYASATPRPEKTLIRNNRSMTGDLLTTALSTRSDWPYGATVGLEWPPTAITDGRAYLVPSAAAKPGTNSFAVVTTLTVPTNLPSAQVCVWFLDTKLSSGTNDMCLYITTDGKLRLNAEMQAANYANYDLPAFCSEYGGKPVVLVVQRYHDEQFPTIWVDNEKHEVTAWTSTFGAGADLSAANILGDTAISIGGRGTGYPLLDTVVHKWALYYGELSDDQIEDLRTSWTTTLTAPGSFSGATEGVVIDYQFAEGTGTSLTDSSGNSQTGTAGAGVRWLGPDYIDATVIRAGALPATIPKDHAGIFVADDALTAAAGSARLWTTTEDGKSGMIDIKNGQGWRSTVTTQRTSLAGTTKIVDESGDAIGNFDTGWTVGASWTTNSSSAVVNATGATNSLSHTTVTALVGPPRYVTMTLVSGGAWTVDATASLTVTMGGSLVRTFTNADPPSGTMTISGMVDGTTDEVVFTVYAPTGTTVSGSFDNFKIEVLAAGDLLHRHMYPAAALVQNASAGPYFTFTAGGTHAANENAKTKVIALTTQTVTDTPYVLASVTSTNNGGSWRMEGKVYASTVGSAKDRFSLELLYTDAGREEFEHGTNYTLLQTYTLSLPVTEITGSEFAWNAAGYFLIGANADTADGDVTINTSSVEYKP